MSLLCSHPVIGICLFCFVSFVCFVTVLTVWNSAHSTVILDTSKSHHSSCVPCSRRPHFNQCSNLWQHGSTAGSVTTSHLLGLILRFAYCLRGVFACSSVCVAFLPAASLFSTHTSRATSLCVFVCPIQGVFALCHQCGISYQRTFSFSRQEFAFNTFASYSCIPVLSGFVNLFKSCYPDTVSLLHQMMCVSYKEVSLFLKINRFALCSKPNKTNKWKLKTRDTHGTWLVFEQCSIWRAQHILNSGILTLRRHDPTSHTDGYKIRKCLILG